MSDPDKRVMVDYYEGAYGPTLLVILRSLDQALKLRSVFISLSELTKLEVRLSDIEWFLLRGIDDLILRIATEPSEDMKSLKKITSGFEEVVFLWAQSSAGWAHCVGLLDGLLKHGGPAHQYLTAEDIDEALVEVSFMEDLRDTS